MISYAMVHDGLWYVYNDVLISIFVHPNTNPASVLILEHVLH